jgi:hypothetical protein
MLEFNSKDYFNKFILKNYLTKIYFTNNHNCENSIIKKFGIREIIKDYIINKNLIKFGP